MHTLESAFFFFFFFLFFLGIGLVMHISIPSVSFSHKHCHIVCCQDDVPGMALIVVEVIAAAASVHDAACC